MFYLHVNIIITVVLCIILWGLCIAYYLNKYFIIPIKHLKDIDQNLMNVLVERMKLTSFIKDISLSLNQTNTMHENLKQCAETIEYNLNAALSRIWLFNEKENVLELTASSGKYIKTDDYHCCVPIWNHIVGIIAKEQKPYITNSFISDPNNIDNERAKRDGITAYAGYPLLIERRLVGVVEMFLQKPQSNFKVRALSSAADIIALGIDRKSREEALRDSEMRLKSVLDNTTAVVCVKDVTGKYILINKRCEELLHISSKDVISKTDYDIFSKEYADIFRKNDMEVLETGKSLQFEEIVPYDNCRHTYISVKFPLFDSYGGIYAICVISIDITDRKRMEEELRVSENKYRILLENLPQRIFLKDTDSVYITCNENYAMDIGITTDEISGMTDYDFYTKALADKYKSDDIRIMKTGKAEELEEKFLKDGKEYFIHTVKTPIKNKRGEITGILGIFWDITEKINLQIETTRFRHMASLGELAAGVAHEINNPVNGIINYAQVLMDKGNAGSKEYDIADRIKKEGIRIANIVTSLLSFARPGDKKEWKNIANVYDILSDTLVLTEAQLQKEGITIKIDIPLSLSKEKLFVNTQQIQQVFLNILSNARYALNQKYKKAHENKIIEVTCEKVFIEHHPHLKIAFRDRGIGISHTMIDKVMDPFFTSKPKGKGTGLGLSISHGIISDHGGRILINSIEGEFTKVIVILPINEENRFRG